jgi:hypothetical protein
VITRQPQLVDGPVAQRTLLVPGVLLLAREDRINRFGAIGTDVTKGIGYENAPRRNEAYHRQKKNDRQAGNLLWNHGRPISEAHWVQSPRGDELSLTPNLGKGQ